MIMSDSSHDLPQAHDEVCVPSTGEESFNKKTTNFSRKNISGRVLSIQSHVVHGHVGNKCAVFPLQVMGLDVDPVHSVQFSNTPAYPGGFKGSATTGEELLALVEGLKGNGLTAGYTHVLTGYISSVGMLRAVQEVVEKLKESNKDLIYVCDPVMGDNGQFYVSPDLLPIYRDGLVKSATLLTPNQFEIEQMTGMVVTSDKEAFQACEMLHDLGAVSVLVTSLEIYNLEAGDEYLLIGSTRAPQIKGAAKKFKIQVPKVPMTFGGTGDLLTACLLGWSTAFPGQLGFATCTSLCVVQAVLHRTVTDFTKAGNTSNGVLPELRLIQSLDELLQPPSMETFNIKYTALD